MEKMTTLERFLYVLGTYRNPYHLLKHVKWKFLTRISTEKVIFLVGAPRSGTTLLQNVLRSHSSVYSIEGETDLFQGKRNIFATNRRHFEFNEAELKSLYQQSSDIVDFFDRSMRLLHEKNEFLIFVEKTPQHIFKVDYLLQKFENAKVVHIVRDARDSYLSASKHSGVPQAATCESWCRYWKACVSNVIGCRSDRVMTIRYEDLVTSPAKETKALMSFVGLEFQVGQLDPKNIGADKRAASPHFKKLAGPIDRKSVGSWIHCLSDADKMIFERLVGAELRHFGY